MPLGAQRLINVPKTCGPPDQGTDRFGICKIFLAEVSKFFSVALRSSPKVDFWFGPRILGIEFEMSSTKTFGVKIDIFFVWGLV